MIVNAGFEKKIKEPGSKKAKFVYKNIQGISIPNNLLPTQIRGFIREYAPEGEGWTLIGFSIIDRVRNNMAMKDRICDKCKSVVKEDEICPCLKTRISNSGEKVSVFILNKETEVLVFHMDIERLQNTSESSLNEIKKVFDGIPILMLDKEVKMSVVKKEV